jgi:Polysaccharide lyase
VSFADVVRKLPAVMLLIQPIAFALADDLPGKEIKPGASPGKPVVTGSSEIIRGSFSKNAKYGMRLVPDPLGVPGQALRMELHYGDCGKGGGWNDCDHGTERVELVGQNSYPEGTLLRFGWKVFFPADFKSKGAWLVLGQLHQRDSTIPLFQVYYQGLGLQIKRFVKTASGFYADDHNVIVTEENLRGVWHDIDITALISRTEKGSFTVRADGEEVYKYEGPTLTVKRAYFKLGIYRLDTSPREPPVVVYYRDIYAK